jgi:BirA family transcriptional regulator, biotin operon repressor / biotin---[acetyl-CoA-carboxylase] ligase
MISAFLTSWPIHRFSEIDSTNEEARRRAAQGDLSPCWLTAKVQTAGRGRLGRQWDSPAGNLFATALFQFPRPPAEAALASYSAGLAVLDAAKAAGIDTTILKLKWPNDVLAGDAKLAGILIETGMHHGQLWMAAGFGINIASAPLILSRAEGPVEGRPDRPTACLSQLPGGQGATADQILGALDIAFRSRLTSLLTTGFGSTREAWLSHAAHLGRRVEIAAASGSIAGVMRGLCDDGALSIELDGGGIAHIRAGEISLLG